MKLEIIIAEVEANLLRNLKINDARRVLNIEYFERYEVDMLVTYGYLKEPENINGKYILSHIGSLVRQAVLSHKADTVPKT